MASTKNLFGAGATAPTNKSGQLFGGAAQAVTKTPAAQDANPWQPVLSFGQTLIDIISTPLYAVEGGIAAAQKGKNPIAGAAENAVAWTQGKRPQTGSDVLKNAGMSNDFWSSLAADIALDPLTYTPGVVISAPIKAALAAGKFAVKGGTAAAKGAVSVGSAGAKAGKAAEKIVSAPRVQVAGSTAKQAVQTAAKEKMAKFVYQPVEVSGARSASEALRQMFASSAEAGYKGARMSIEKSLLKEAERKIGKAERKITKAGGVIDTPNAIVQSLKVTEEAAPKVATDITPAAVAAADAQAKKLPSQVIRTTDTAPQMVTPLELDAMTRPLTKDTQKSIKSGLNKIDSIVKKVVGTTVGKDELIGKINDILSKDKENLYYFYNQVIPETKTLLANAIKREGNLNIVDTLRDFAVATSKQKNLIVKSVADRVVVAADGSKYKISDVLSNAQFNKPYDELDPTLRAGIEAIMRENLFAGQGPKAIESLNLKKISDLTGEEIAKKLQNAGALSPDKVTDAAKVKSILDTLAAGGEKKYKNFDEFISGIRSGDIIDAKALKNVLKAIDPEHKAITQIDAAVASPQDIRALKTALVHDGANSVEATKRRLELLDAETFLESDPIGFKDVAAATINDLLTGRAELDEAASLQTQAQAAERIVQYENMSLGGYVKDASDSIGRGMKPQIGAIYKAADQESGGISRLGEGYLRVKDATEGPVAIVARVFSQHLETYILGSILGKETYRRLKAQSIATAKGLEYTPKMARMDDYILRTGIAEDIMLANFRVRPTHVKSVAKLRGGVEDAYHHYVSSHDFASVMRDFEQTELFNKIMFPADTFPGATITRKTDWVSPQAIGDAIGELLQAMERGTPVDPEALIKAINTPAPRRVINSKTGKQELKPGEWSDDFKKIMDKASVEVYDFLKSDEVMARFADIHTSKLKAETFDAFRPAQKFSTDMVTALVNAYGAMRDAGISSMAKRQEIALSWMNKFAAGAHIFNMSNGETARALFRSTARIFLELTDMNKTGVASEYRAIMEAAASSNKAMDEMYPELMNAINSTFDWDVTGNGKMPFVTDKAINDATIALESIEDAYIKHAAALTTDLGPQAVAAWRKTRDVLQAQLDKARFAAAKAGVPTRHLYNGEWIPTDRYNHATAVAEAARSRSRYIITEKGRVDIAKYLTDTEAVQPTFAKFGVKHTKETKAFWEAQSRTRRAKNAKNAEAQASETVLKLQQESEALFPDDELSQVAREIQEKNFQTQNAGEIKITQEVNTPDNVYLGASTRAGVKRGVEKGVTRASLLGEAAQAGAGMVDIMGVVNKADSTYYNAIGAVDVYLKNLIGFYKKTKMTPDDFESALAAAVSGRAIDNTAEDAVSEMTRQLRKLLDETMAHMEKRGMTPNLLKRAFAIRGLNEFTGIPNLDEFNNSKDIARLFQMLPISEAPEFLTKAANDADPKIAAAGQASLNAFLDNKAKFKRKSLENKDAMSGVALLHNVISAIQFASHEMTLADDLVQQFNYAADGISLEAARKSGDYVFVKSAGDGFSLTSHFPQTVEGGNYFHKDIAKAIFANDRAYNYTFGKNLAPWLKNMMGILSFFKATQTILRPGHLAANMAGDTSIAMMTGAGPTHFASGARYAMKFAGRKVEADWKSSGAEARWNAVVSGFEGIGGRELKTSDKGLQVVIGGKQVTLDDEYVIGSMQDANVLVGDIQVNDSLAMYNEMSAVAATSDQSAALQKNWLQRLGNGINKGTTTKAYQTAIKPAGDVVAYMGNIPRTATALRVMSSRNWNSASEMWAAVNKEVNLYHPTIQSLSAVERKGPRLLFTYYTWLRGAHTAFVKLATDHTAAMLIPSKIFYNQALANEMGPGSIGNLWGNKQDTPDYLNYSVYGPTMAGPRGAMLYRPSILPLDVLDNWNISYDSSKSIDQNAFNNLVSTGRMLGRNINLLAQPGIELLTGTDVGTGKPSTVKDLKTAGEELLSNIGTTQLFKGLGLYTPSNKGPESANPLTDRDRQVALQNFLFGMRTADVYTPANIKYGSQDVTDRMTRVIENLQQKNEGQ